MKLLAAYLRQRRSAVLYFLLSCGIFAAALSLYRLPLAAVLYPALLCALAGLLFFLRDFFQVKQKHETLRRIQGLTDAMPSALPEASGVLEADYQEMVKAFLQEAKDREAAAAARYQDMIEYYTLWAHQVKTPITSMRLTLEKEDSPLSRKLSSDLFGIEGYVEMVLTFLRLDTDSTDYVFRECDLDELLRQSIAKFSSEFITRRIGLEYIPTGEKVVTDPKWFSFVVEQLLSNALKYTREGSIRIDLPHPRVLRIQDTGIGIAPSDLPRVFEKGYTGYNGREDKRSSGIGLYLCRRICTRLGMEITIASEPGKGTAVSLFLKQYEGTKE